MSGKATAVHFQLCVHYQKGSLTTKNFSCNLIGFPTFLHKTQTVEFDHLCNNSNAKGGLWTIYMTQGDIFIKAHSRGRI